MLPLAGKSANFLIASPRPPAVDTPLHAWRGKLRAAEQGEATHSPLFKLLISFLHLRNTHHHA